MKIASPNFDLLLPKILFKSIKILPASDSMLFGAAASKTPQQQRADYAAAAAQTQKSHAQGPGAEETIRLEVELSIQTINPAGLLDYGLFFAIVSNNKELRLLQTYKSYVKDHILNPKNTPVIFKQFINSNWRGGPGTGSPNFQCQRVINSGNKPKVYIHTTTLSAEISAAKFPSLSLYCVPYQLIPAGRGQNGVGDKHFLVGECVSEHCLVNNRTYPLSNTYTYQNSGPWGEKGEKYVGPVYQNGLGKYLPAYPGAPAKGLLIQKKVPNQKVKDLRFLRNLSLQRTQVAKKQGGYREEALNAALDNNYFSNFYFSTNELGNSRIFFNFNFSNFALNNSTLAKIIINPTSLRECFSIEEVKITRAAVDGQSGQNRLTGDTSPTSVNEASRTRIPVGAVSTGEVKITSPVGPDILSIVACDNTLVDSNVATQYQEYILDFVFRDNASQVLRNIHQKLREHLNAYNLYLDSFLGLYRKTSLCMDEYIDANINIFASDSSWKHLIDYFLATLEFIGGNQFFGKYELEYWQRNLYALANPYSSTPTEALRLEEIIARFTKGLGELLNKGSVQGDPDHHELKKGSSPGDSNARAKRIEFSHTISERYRRVQDPGVGINYLNPSLTYENPDGLTTISFDNFKRRIQQEARKFSVRDKKRVNEYGYLTPWALQSSTEILRNNGVNFQQTWRFLATKFSEEKRSRHGSVAYNFDDPPPTEQAVVNQLLTSRGITITPNRGSLTQTAQAADAAALQQLQLKQALEEARKAQLNKDKVPDSLEGQEAYDAATAKAALIRKEILQGSEGLTTAEALDYVGDESNFNNQTSETTQGDETPRTEVIATELLDGVSADAIVVVNVISNLATNTFNIREDNSVNTSNTIGVAGSYPAATIREDPTTFVNLVTNYGADGNPQYADVVGDGTTPISTWGSLPGVITNVQGTGTPISAYGTAGGEIDADGNVIVTGDRAGGDGNCVVKGTYIDTDKGKVLVENITTDTKVLSHNFETSEMGYFKVVGTVTNTVDGWCKIKTKGGFELGCSLDHPIMSKDAAFLELAASDASPGDHVWIVKGGELRDDVVESVEVFDGLTEVYNMEVGSVHTYVSDGILSHNMAVNPTHVPPAGTGQGPSAGNKGGGGGFYKPVPCEEELPGFDSDLFNPYYVDMNYNSIVRLEFLSRSGRRRNERWAVLTAAVFNRAQQSGRSLVIRMVTCGAIVRNGGNYTDGLDILNQVFVIGPALRRASFGSTTYSSIFRNYVKNIGSKKLSTDVRNQFSSIQSEYLCGDSMIFMYKKMISTASKASYAGANRIMQGTSLADVARARGLRRNSKVRLRRGQKKLQQGRAAMNPTKGGSY